MYSHFFKRLFDIIGSLILLPLLFIVFIILAPIIYFTDRGPVFYNAPRRGLSGKTFSMYKFRSMKVDAPDLRNTDGSTFSGDNDPRVTKIGRIMRKTSLDELPQFLNVLKGDMSFIGPRPTLAVKKLSELSDLELRRYKVRPGITGYSQAYYRNSISQKEKFEKDIYYAENISMMMDIKILFKTIQSVLMQENINTEKKHKF